jgi:flagellar assembly factor FliW
MNVRTTLTGVESTVDVPAEQVYAFEPALGGFPDLRRYVLIPESDSVVEWLQSVDDPTVAFALVEPFLFVPEYSFEIPEADVRALGLQSTDDAIVRCVVTLREDANEITANLLAPLVLSRRTHLARQVILQDADWPLRHPLFVEAAEDSHLAASA